MNKIITLNLRHGGGTRIDAIRDYLLGQNADAMICTEIRTNRQGEILERRFVAEGYQCVRASTDDAKQNSVAIFSRVGAEPISLKPADVNRQRVVGCRIGGLTLVGVYFALGHNKVSPVDYLLSARRSSAQMPS